VQQFGKDGLFFGDPELLGRIPDQGGPTAGMCGPLLGGLLLGAVKPPRQPRSKHRILGPTLNCCRVPQEPQILLTYLQGTK